MIEIVIHTNAALELAKKQLSNFNGSLSAPSKRRNYLHWINCVTVVVSVVVVVVFLSLARSMTKMKTIVLHSHIFSSYLRSSPNNIARAAGGFPTSSHERPAAPQPPPIATVSNNVCCYCCSTFNWLIIFSLLLLLPALDFLRLYNKHSFVCRCS